MDEGGITIRLWAARNQRVGTGRRFALVALEALSQSVRQAPLALLCELQRPLRRRPSSV